MSCRPEKQEGPRVLALPLYGIGDVLMTTPALKTIKEKLPSSRVTFLHMFRTTRDILLGNPNVDENIHFPFLEAGRWKGAGFALGLRSQKFDAAINFYPSNRKDYNIASFLSGCGIRIGHTYEVRNLRELNFLKNRTLREDDRLHNVEENLRLLSFLGIKDAGKNKNSCPLEIFLTAREDRAAIEWLESAGIEGGAPLIGLHPGTSAFKGHVKKRWPLERFSEVMDGLASDLPGGFLPFFLVFGGPEEAPLKRAVMEKCASRSRVRAVDTAEIRQTAALMKRCGLFIANDSGLMHMAAALQVPTVAIFGPTDPRWVSPWKCPSRVVGPGGNVPCAPCFRYSPKEMKCDRKPEFQCLTDIDAAQVLDAARSLLGGDF